MNIFLGFGILYPAYASYKTVKTKNVRDYVKWMMYWIVFALYTSIEIFTDMFLAFWFPFYYEFKILFVLWLICPATRGSTYIFKKFINPLLSRHEAVLDAYISSSLDNGFEVLKKLGAQGIEYIRHFVIEFLNKGQTTAINCLPKISEMAQSNAAIQSTQGNSLPSNSLDYITLEDEEFDILEAESSRLSSNTMATSSSQMHLGNSEYRTSDSDTESEDLISVKKRPLKVAAKKKTKEMLNLCD
ncbi:receptor expression-enhancing protein 4 [Nephila pilipes]|uniref:Receptor expression-enhancing protein n=1 Tax=Nephila pilipes TaxID=299642 RepID=A0A8X6UTM7_NEPPI|nr:receptor expression-enhancing protein 4 [Nephila pilipes]